MNATNRVLATVPIQLVSAGGDAINRDVQQSDKEATPVVVYPGLRRDALGRSAAVSWINEEGRGVIHSVYKNTFLHLILDGAATRYTSPTKSTPTGFLLCACALAMPAAITGARLCDLTKFSAFTVWRWLEALERDGWIAAVAKEKRSQSFSLTEMGILRCAEQVEAGWQQWRKNARLGRSVPPAVRYYFLSLVADSVDYESGVEDEMLAFTGIESLFRDGDLMRIGSVKETAFITTPIGLERIVGKFRISLRAERDFAGASEVTVIPSTHPFFQIINARHKNNFSPLWPPGFGALDALDHPDVRVADVARSQWERWVATVGSHAKPVGVPRA